MATRLYFDAVTEPAISPTFDAGWARTDQAVRRRLNRTVQASAMTDFQCTTSASGVPNFVLTAQFLLVGLAAQTLTGTCTGQVRAFASSGALNATLAVRVAVCDVDGANILEALAINAAAVTTTTIPPEFALLRTNRRFLTTAEATPLTLSDTEIPVNGALLVEVGYRTENTNQARSSTLVFGDDNVSDLPEDDAETDALNPWIEFSMDLTEYQDVGSTPLSWLGGTRVAGGVKRYQAIPSGFTPPGRPE